MARRYQWFREGADAFRRFQRLAGNEHRLPPNQEVYACPLCLQVLFSIEALETKDLTVEHAPPKRLGGPELALTCRWCNSGSGTSFDAEAVKEWRFRKLLEGQSGQGSRARLTFDGVTVRGNLHIAGRTGLLFGGVQKANGEAKLERLETVMKQWANSGRQDVGFEIEVEDRFSAERAQISWVRSAYIVAFAALGWRYIAQTSLTPIRDQLRDPDVITLPSVGFFEPNADDDRREFLVVEEPADCASVAVALGRNVVFLPAIDSTRPLPDLVRSLHSHQPANSGRHEFGGQLVPWPTKPLYALDVECN